MLDFPDPPEDSKDETLEGSAEGQEESEMSAEEVGTEVDSEVIVGEIVDEDEITTTEPEVMSPDERVKLIKRDPVSAYVQQAKQFPLLSREEENELAKRYSEFGDLSAARKLIESNLRLVVKIAYEYRRAHRHLLDLIQEGNVGLMKAVEKFDPERGVKLSSYAAWWIRAYILKFVLDNWRLVKVGTTQAQRKLFYNLNKEKARLQQMGFSPTPRLLAENLDVREDEVIEMEKRLAAPDASLDAPAAADDDGGRTFLDTLSGGSESPYELAEHSQLRERLQEIIEDVREGLSERDQRILDERLVSPDPKTLVELAADFGVSRERVRQLEARIRKKLADRVRETLGDPSDLGIEGG